MVKAPPARAWATLLTVMLLASTACYRSENASNNSALGGLRGRCVRILGPMDLVESGGDRETVAYLRPRYGGTGAAHSLGQLQAGAEFVIERVALEKDLTGQRAVVVARHVGKYSNLTVSLGMLFDYEWKSRAQRATFDGEPSPRNIPILLPEFAEWCESPPRVKSVRER
jgi:hypothetical protein